MARARAKLGFKDVEESEDGTVIDATKGDGVRDEVFEQLKVDERRYTSEADAKTARPEVKIATEVDGISKEEHLASMLKDAEKF